jgi:hypothetical protein
VQCERCEALRTPPRLKLGSRWGWPTAVLQLLAREDEALLSRGVAVLVLDLCFHSVDGAGRLHFKGDGLAGLDEQLHATAQAQHQVQRALHLDVVVGESAVVNELLAREDEALLLRECVPCLGYWPSQR